MIGSLLKFKKKGMINIFLLVLLHKTWIINNYNWIGLQKNNKWKL